MKKKKPLKYENSTCFSHIRVFFTCYKSDTSVEVASLLLGGYAIATITMMRQACTCGPVWAPVPTPKCSKYVEDRCSYNYHSFSSALK